MVEAFALINELRKGHANLLNAMQYGPIANWEQALMPLLGLHQRYVNLYELFVGKLPAEIEKSLATTLTGYPISAILVRPIQRLAKYPLLMTALIKQVGHEARSLDDLIGFQEACTQFALQANERSSVKNKI